MNKANFRDPRFWLLGAALLCFTAALVVPPVGARRDSFDLLVVTDITGSMNTRDYSEEGRPVSRLEKVKTILRQMLIDLPCQSHVALGLFAERDIFLLFRPIEVCSNFAPISGTVAALNWREGWEGDSHIAEGLYRAIALASDLHTDLMFMTDGQEAPPLPWSGGPTFDGKPGAIKGVIVGVGGYALSPIPKYDDNGRQIGFYGPDDVLQESRFGLPPPGAEKRPGYNPRNAPFGNVNINNNEHLSSVKEPYLKGLARKTGLGYAHLIDERGLLEMLRARATRHPVDVMVEPGSIATALGLICLGGVYAVLPLLAALTASYRRQRATLRPKEPASRHPGDAAIAAGAKPQSPA